MRKNKKLLLGGLSVLTLVAAGSGAVSTFAWFTATQTNHKETVAPSGTLSADSESLASGDYYIVPVWKAVASVPNDAEDLSASGAHSLSLTDNGGDCFAAVDVGTGNSHTYIAATATPKYKKYGVIALDFEVYKTKTTNPIAYSNKITDPDVLKALQGTYTFTVSSTENRVKFGKTDAADSYDAVYGTSVTVTVTISNAGEISDDLATLYVSLGGPKSANANVSAGDTIPAADIDSEPITATFTCTGE